MQRLTCFWFWFLFLPNKKTKILFKEKELNSKNGFRLDKIQRWKVYKNRKVIFCFRLYSYFYPWGIFLRSFRFWSSSLYYVPFSFDLLKLFFCIFCYPYLHRFSSSVITQLSSQETNVCLFIKRNHKSYEWTQTKDFPLPILTKDSTTWCSFQKKRETPYFNNT